MQETKILKSLFIRQSATTVVIQVLIAKLCFTTLFKLAVCAAQKRLSKKLTRFVPARPPAVTRT